MDRVCGRVNAEIAMDAVFYIGQNQPTNPSGPTPAEVIITGAPSRIELMFAVEGPNVSGARGSLWAQTATTPYGYTQTIQLANFYIGPGAPRSLRQSFPLGDLSYYEFLFGQVDQIDGSGLTSASLTIGVGNLAPAPSDYFYVIDNNGDWVVDNDGDFIVEPR